MRHRRAVPALRVLFELHGSQGSLTNEWIDRDALVNADDVWFRGSVGRVAAMVVVFVVHVTAFVFVTLPTAPFRLHRLSIRLDSGNDLLVRLIDVSAHVADARQQRSMIRRKPPKRRKPDSAHASTRRHRREVQQPARKPLDLTLPNMRTGTGGDKFTVGRRLGPEQTHPRYRLPGGGHVAGAPRLQLADPRTQGIAGVLRALQKKFGVPDPHCIDVDSWRGMTREERFRHHVTEAYIKRVAEEHECVPIRRHSAPPNALHLPWIHSDR